MRILLFTTLLLSLSQPLSFASEGALNCKTLLKQLRQPTKILKTLLVEPSFITSVEGRLGTGAYSTVYKVQTPSGPMALKVYDWEENPKRYANGIIMQRFLANLGFAPKIYGILSTKNMKILVSQHIALLSRIEPNHKVGFGLLMQEIPDAIAVKAAYEISLQKKATMNRLLLKKIHGKLTQISQVLRSLNIEPIDPQILLTPNGDIFVHDLDEYHFIDDSILAKAWYRVKNRVQPRPLHADNFDLLLHEIARLIR